MTAGDLETAGILVAAIAANYKPSPTQHVWQWAEEHVFLDNQQAPGRAGYYDSNKTPWTRRMQELDADPRVDEIIIPKSSRSGVTEAFFNIMRRAPHYSPGHILYMLQNRDKARSVMQRRIIPTMRKCAGEYFTGNLDDVGKSLLRLVNMEIHVHGAGSESPFTEIAFAKIGIDEADDTMAVIDGDETTADLARSRQRDVPGSKLYIFGKMRYRGGLLWSEYIGGTQDKLLLPCPHCNDLIELHEGGLRYEHLAADLVSGDVPGGYDLRELIEGTFYECPACEKPIEERWKRAMLEACAWRPTPTSADVAPSGQHFRVAEREGLDKYPAPFPGRVSMQISDFYTLHEKLRWGHLALMLLEAQRNPHRLAHFVINHTGRGYNAQEASISATEFTRWIGGRKNPDSGEVHGRRYLRGQCPIDPVLVSATGDVQRDLWKFVICAWEIDGSCWVIDWGVVLDARGFDEQLDRKFPIMGDVDGRAVSHDFGQGLIDSRHREADVFEYVLRSRYRIFPSKGLRHTSATPYVSSVKKPWGDQGRVVKAYHYDDRQVKDRYYVDRLQHARPAPVYLPADVDQDFIEENCAEKFLATQDKYGATVQQWIKVGPANDYGDCMKKHFIVWGFNEARLRAQSESGKRTREYRLDAKADARP
jgi:phage terminase large subunit GpA-like protein